MDMKKGTEFPFYDLYSKEARTDEPFIPAKTPTFYFEIESILKGLTKV